VKESIASLKRSAESEAAISRRNDIALRACRSSRDSDSTARFNLPALSHSGPRSRAVHIDHACCVSLTVRPPVADGSDVVQLDGRGIRIL
jgi:hypothetical protein